ncbi:MAG: (4Fe-4S)-binding protein [Ignavibacteriota bacterium]
MESQKEYTNDEITVIWKSDICIHSGNCVRGLSNVFNPKDRPWIKMYSASTDEIIKTVNNCPSGALTYKRNNDMLEKVEATQAAQSKTKVKIIKGGPYMVEGPCTFVDKDGNETFKEGKIFLCRCGGSKNKPYCDGSHKTIEFDK